MPAYTFIGTLSAVQLCGFTPFLMDVNLETWSLDPAQCEAHPNLNRIGLVVPVAPYGRAVPQAPWRAFRDRTGIPVAIDGAAAIEALADKPDLHVGDIPVAVSLHATKSFSTGEGGAVICTDHEVLRFTWQSLNFGYTPDRHSSRPGLNGKMSEYHAAVGLAELDGWAAKRRAYERVAQIYMQLATPLGLKTILNVAPTVSSNYVILDAVDARKSAGIEAELVRRRIGYRFWYGGGLHRSSSFQRFECSYLGNTENLATRLIGLPMAVDMLVDDVKRVVTAIAESVAIG